MIVAGIDEAGLGPVLGPLVVSATAFSLPEDLADLSMWQLLSGTITRKVSKRRAAIAIGDSKKLFDSAQREKGLRNLRRGVLAMLATQGCAPQTLEHLLAAVSPAAIEQARRYPYYHDLSRPLGDGLESALAGNALATALKRAGLALELMRAQTVFEGEFNRHIEATDNKSTLLFDITSRLLMELWQTFPGQPIRIHVDRQGGRMPYLPVLQRLFEGGRFKILEEEETLSAYRMTLDERTAEFYFAVGGEERHLPVALASMLSKFVRELLMGAFNDFWAAHVPGIAPTAGYYVDGERFYREIQHAARQLGIEAHRLRRSR